MSRKLRLLVGRLTIAVLVAGTIFTFLPKKINQEQSITELRKAHEEFLKNSPFKETLTWDKKKRMLNGLPPNRYFEQMWELSVNPSTGRLDDGELTLLREQLIEDRLLGRSPGENTNAWEERGPNDIGGRTRAILFDPNDSSNNTVYAGGVSGGLWRNTNITSSSSSWTRVQGLPGNLSVTSITVDPRNSNRWYIGTGEQYTAGDVVGNGVYVTTDGGTNWSALNIPPADGGGDINFNASNLFLSGIYYVNDVLAWDNGTSTELFVAVGANAYGDSSSPTNWLGLQSSGLYRSTDNGSTWNRIESANMQHVFSGSTYYYIPNDLEVGADNKLWMGTIGSALGEGGGRVFSSTNGATWTEAAASPLTDSNRVEIEPSASNPNKLYALVQGVSSPVHIYSTTNGFGSITEEALPNDADTGIPANDFCRGQAFYDLVIEADPNNDNIVYVGGIDLFRSTNGGSSWAQISKWSNNNNLAGLSSSLVHADQHAMTFRPGNSNQAIFGTDGGVYYASSLSTAQNSDVFGARNNNYNVTQYVKAGIGPDGAGDTDGIFTAGSQDNGSQAFRNATPGINGSEELSDGDGFYTFVDRDGQYMIATFVRNVIYRFNLPWNGLGRRQGGATTLSNDQSRGDFVNQMDYDDDANRLLTNNSNSTQNAIKSINVASNSSGSLTNNALTAKPTAFRASPFANNTWYVGLANGGLLRLTNVTNTSASWTTITTPFVGSVSSVRFGATANDLIVTMHNYGVTSIWYSSDAGANWVSKEGDLPNIPVRDFLLNPLNNNEAVIATQLGTWSTSNFNDASPTWFQAYNGMSDVSVTSFDYWAIGGDDTNNRIIASTYGRGVFTGQFTATSVPDTDPPSAPTNLTASNTTESTTDLSWTASTDNVGVTGYDVYQGASVIATVSTTTYQVTGLTANTNYTFSVRAKDGAGNESASSNQVNVTTQAPDTTAPSAPTNLVANNTTASSTDLSWTASTDNVGVASYDVYQGASVIGNVTGTSFGVTGLNAETTYTFTVRAKDAAGNESGASNEAVVTTDATPITYCASASTNVNDEYISRVQLNTIDNSSGAQFYSDFTGISTTLTKGTQYTITVTPTWTGTVYAEAYAVWIDYNRDGDFTDAGEQVFAQAPTTTTPVSGNFTIPAGAVENATRMRVSMKYNAAPTSCETFTYGEVEDYTVVIEASGPDTEAPSAPTSLAASNTTQTTTDLSWNASTDNVGVTGYDVYQGASVIATVSTTTYQVTGLTASTNYAFSVRAKDAAGNESAASNTANVTTLDPPDTTAPTAPTNLTASNTTQTTTDLSWTASTDNVGVTGYDVYQGASVIATVSTTTYQVTGLTASTSYSFNVRAKDAAGNESAASNTANVTTLDIPDTTPPVIVLNGPSTVNLLVGDSYVEQGATATDNVDGDLTASIVISGSVNTAVAGTYFINYNVSDAAGNAATQVTRTVNVSEPTNGCSGGISTFPYSEGFEGSIGGWSQSSADDLNWLVDANGTPSNNTGPSSAVEGTDYIYVEASGNGTGYPNKRAIITSPCFNLAGLTEATFSFKYHMFGSNDMGSIDLEISDDDGATWTSIWNQTGNQGNQWLTVNVNLNAYVGGGIQLRFNRLTGGTWQADIAIDDIGLIDSEVVVNSCSGGITAYPYSQGFEGSIGDWSQSTSDDLNWLVDANGTPSNNTGPSSATEGSNYIYVEASGNGTGYPNKQAIINSPCFDLSSAASASFSFSYHMFGSNDMGSIALEASNDDGASWTTIWSQTGNQGNQWQSQAVDLAAYVGNSVQLRFNRVTGGTWQADIAIDNISLTTSNTPKTEGPIGVIENDEVKEIKLYPNPVKGNTITLINSYNEVSYEIYNTAGRVVAKGRVSSTNKIDVSELEAALYLVQFTTEEGPVIKRFIKQ